MASGFGSEVATATATRWDLCLEKVRVGRNKIVNI